MFTKVDVEIEFTNYKYSNYYLFYYNCLEIQFFIFKYNLSEIMRPL